MNRARSIAVVGAGMAGLACARALIRGGMDVAVFDKGRRPGGRIATKRIGAAHFNHGAQYATARSAGFSSLIGAMLDAGSVAPWIADSPEHWVGMPGMSAIPAHLADIPVASLRHVAHLARTPDGWNLHHDDAAATPPGSVAERGRARSFDATVLAIPAPQAARLLAACPHPFSSALAAVHIAPCWTLMLAADAHGPATQRPESGPLAWIARENSRPGREPKPVCWTAHATPEWSRAWLERDPADVQAALLAAFAAAIGPVSPAIAAVHRWRFAMTETPLGQPFLWDEAAQLGVCGDWCTGARVEAAWQSGHDLAAAMLG